MAADVVLDYSHIPLLMSAALGVLLLLVTCVAGIVALLTRWDPLTSATALLIFAMTFVGGLVLLNLGIVGAYLGRAATEARGRPLYFLESSVGIETEQHRSR